MQSLQLSRFPLRPDLHRPVWQVARIAGQTQFSTASDDVGAKVDTLYTTVYYCVKCHRFNHYLHQVD